MCKRFLAMLLALVLVASWLPAGVLAEEPQAHIHCLCGRQTTLGAACDSCGSAAVEWTACEAMPTAAGNYYLTKDVSAELLEYTGDIQVNICLCGHNVTSTNGERILTVAGGAQVNITDCAGQPGSFTGCDTNKYGLVMRVNAGSTLRLYGGRITGNTAPSGGDGTVYVDKGTSTKEGGAFYLYGGQISGNTARRGAGVFSAAATDAVKPGSIYILGGTITGNEGKGTGGTKGGAGVLGFGPVTIGGNAVISGNTAAEGYADIYLRDSGYKGQLLVSSQVPLTQGACVDFGNDAAQDPQDLSCIAGTPESWNCHWVTYGGQSVSYASGKFLLGHYHGEQKYEPISTNAQLRDFSGNGYLTKDLNLGGPQTWKQNKNLCLNGHTIKADPEERVFSTENASPVTITLQDCTAYTDENGVYHAGKLTGGENQSGGGGAFSIATGSKVCLQEGILTGNSSAVAGGAVLVNGEFCMEGGQISDNLAKNGDTWKNGGAIFVNRDGKVTISGGRIFGNQGAKGSVFYSNSTSVLNLTGGTITGNTAYECGAFFVGSGVSCTLSGSPVVKDNLLGSQAHNLYLPGDSVIRIDQLEDQALIGVRAEAGNRAISGDCADVRRCFTSDDPDLAVTYQEGKLFLEVPITHIHCVCGSSSCTDHESAGFAPWTATDSLPESGCYYLTQDVVVTGQANLDNTQLTLCLNGHTVKTQEGKSLRFFYLKGNSQLTITDCSATAGTFTGAAKSAIMTENVEDAAPVIHLYAGNFTGNRGEAGGGAVLLQGKATLNMYGGSLTGNTTAGALGGGAVCQYGDKTAFHLYGGTLTGNTATATAEGKGGVGGAVYARGTVTVHGGTLTGNTAQKLGGGIYLDTQAQDIVLSGAAVVTDNTANGKKSNLHLSGGQLLLPERLEQSAKVGISGAAPFTTVSAPCEDVSSQILSDGDSYFITYQDGALYLDARTDHNHCLCAGQAQGCDHTQISLAPWESSDSLPASGRYYLTADVQLTKEAGVKGDLILCLNGHTVTAAQDSRILSTPKDAGLTLTITDCAQTPGKLTGGKDLTTAGGGAMFIRSGNTLKLFGGQLCGNTSVTAGGAIVIAGDARLELHGGLITDNAAAAEGKTKNGGGVFINSGGQLVFTGGTVRHNTGALGGGIYANNAQVDFCGGTVDSNKGTSGGGIYCTDGVTLTMSGGTVSNNSATSNGGGIYMATGSQLTVTGGTITGNKTESNGGGLYLLKQQVSLSGCTISENTAVSGGGVYLNGAQATVTNGTISENSATTGAGVFVNTVGSGTQEVFPASLTLGKGGEINRNKAQTNGGGVLVSGEKAQLKLEGGVLSGNSAKNAGGVLLQGKASATLSSGSVSGNTATSGGGIYVSTTATLTMAGGSVSGNASAKNGGGIYLLRSNATLQGGSVSGNSGESGAGIYCAGSQLKLSGTAVTGNTAQKNGGGLMVTLSSVTKNGVKTVYESIVTLTGGTISENKAVNAAGILIQGSSAKLDMQGGTITRNHASSSGGGVYVSTNSAMTMTGGKITGNTTDKYGGGMWANKCQVQLLAGEISNNAVPTSGGGLVASNTSTVFVGKDMKIFGNTAKAAAGMLCQSRAVLTVDGAEIYGNKATALGGGLYVSSKSFGIVKNAYFHENEAGTNGGGMYCNQNATLTVEDTRIEKNLSVSGGAGLFNRGNTTVKGCVVRGNESGADGGGLGSFKMSYKGGLYVEDTQVLDNKAAGCGGGIYFSLGCFGSARNVTLQGNTAGEEGGALWAKDELKLYDLTATGNTSGGEGYAVWLSESDFDGQSYIAGAISMGGNVIIKDNRGGDLFLGEQTTIAIPGGVIGEDTYINITLASGVLTRKVFGQYDYTGGDLVYTITYGQRSITEPEAVPQEQPTEDTQDTQLQDQETAPGDNSLLYIGIGGIAAVVIAAAVVLVLVKKKKSARAGSQE